MEITFNDLKSKDIINIYDGKKLGRASDISFDKSSGAVLGIVVPGEHRIFRKPDDIFIPISRIRKIGEDVILVKLSPEQPSIINNSEQKPVYNSKDRTVYARYRRVVQKEK